MSLTATKENNLFIGMIVDGMDLEEIQKYQNRKINYNVLLEEVKDFTKTIKSKMDFLKDRYNVDTIIDTTEPIETMVKLNVDLKVVKNV